MTDKRIGAMALALLFSTLGSQASAQIQTISLDEAITLALQEQPAMVQARGQLSLAGASKRQVVGSWLPSLSVSSSWSTNSSQRFDPATQRNISAASTSASGGLSSSLELFDGFRRVAQGRSANADAASAEASLTNQEFQIVLQTKQIFYDALAAEELVRVSELQIQRAEEQLKIAKDKLAAGTATRSDTLRSTVELGNARLQKLNGETQRAIAEANLGRLVGADGPVRAQPDQRLTAIVAIDTMGLRPEALLRAPSIEQADAELRAADAQVAVSRAQYFPSVTASYNNSFSGQTFGALNNSWSIRLSASLPIFNGFSRELNQARSAVARDQAQAVASNERRLVNSELTQFLASLTAAGTRLEIAQASRAAATEDLRVQRERYRLGAATIVDVLTSQVSLQQAEVDEVQSRFDYLVAKAQIEALIGREL